MYAPTSDCDDEVIDEFYEDLERLIRTIPRKKYNGGTRDLNAKNGQDANGGRRGTSGRFGLGAPNGRGRKLRFRK